MKGRKCIDVCADPIIASPKTLSLLAPLIYDEIGINLCASGITVDDIPAGAVQATAQVVTIAPTDGSVTIDAITGRPNCYVVTLSDLTVTLAVKFYDSACRLVGTVFPEVAYLPDEGTETYDEDTNPSSVELEIFAPYGVSYEDTTPTLNIIGFTPTNNFIQQGINLYGMSKLLALDIEEGTITVGLTLVLQSLYFAGYRVESEGKIQTPKGCIITPDNTDCMEFVCGDLLNLAIKPLDLGCPHFDEYKKEPCGCGCGSCGRCCGDAVADDTVPLIEPPAPEPPA